MSRILTDELEDCKKRNACYDCHADSIVRASAEIQRRGKLEVPVCRAHFNAYKSKTNQADAKKYARTSAAKREIRRCVYKGCHRQLIPRELLPSWIQESTCGMHGTLKASRANRTALLRFIVEDYLTDVERKDMSAQNIIYQPHGSFVWFSMQHPGYYQTKVLSASGLLERFREVQNH